MNEVAQRELGRVLAETADAAGIVRYLVILINDAGDVTVNSSVDERQDVPWLLRCLADQIETIDAAPR